MSSVLARGKTHVARTRPRTGRNRGERASDTFVSLLYTRPLPRLATVAGRN